MKKPKPVLVGDLVKRGLITREDVLALVGQIFDGKRTLPVGPGDCKVVLRRHDSLTRHLQECITTVLLTSEAIPPAGMADEPQDDVDAADLAAAAA